MAEHLDEISIRYRFPPGTGAGERIAIVEPHGGYLDEDLDRALGSDPPPTVTAHSVEASVDGLPVTAKNSPLDAATIGEVLAELRRTHDASAVAKRFAGDAVFTEFMATLEVSLDLQLVARLAPAATIDVWFTPTHLSGLAAGIDHAVESGATVVSISWGQSEESCLRSGERNVRRVEDALTRAKQAGITVCCSSGDYGSLNARAAGDGLVRVNYPASSPSALAVGGTMTSTAPTEVVWNAVEYGLHHASGGGISGMFARPDHQRGLSGPSMESVWQAPGNDDDFVGRAVPDVAVNAGPYSIVIGGQDLDVSGTSACAPIMAALLARVAEHDGSAPGWVVERIYDGAGRGFTDIVDGDDRLAGAARVFAAGPGWDACTGWGTPVGDVLAELLAGR